MNTKAKKPLTDLRRVQIDTRKPIEERTRDLLGAIGDLYLFRVGEVTVQIRFNPSGKDLSEALTSLLSNT